MTYIQDKLDGFHKIFTEYKNIKEYPASDKLGYNGIKNIYLFTPKVV